MRTTKIRRLMVAVPFALALTVALAACQPVSYSNLDGNWHTSVGYFHNSTGKSGWLQVNVADYNHGGGAPYHSNVTAYPHFVESNFRYSVQANPTLWTGWGSVGFKTTYGMYPNENAWVDFYGTCAQSCTAYDNPAGVRVGWQVRLIDGSQQQTVIQEW